MRETRIGRFDLTATKRLVVGLASVNVSRQIEVTILNMLGSGVPITRSATTIIGQNSANPRRLG